MTDAGRYVVSASPHVTSARTTRNIMLDMVIALMPAVIASFLLYGLYPVLAVLLSTAGAVFGEYFYNLVRQKKHTVSDLSAVVTGIILGLNLPPVIPLYVPLVGGVFATDRKSVV